MLRTPSSRWSYQTLVKGWEQYAGESAAEPVARGQDQEVVAQRGLEPVAERHGKGAVDGGVVSDDESVILRAQRSGQVDFERTSRALHIVFSQFKVRRIVGAGARPHDSVVDDVGGDDGVVLSEQQSAFGDAQFAGA